MKGNGKTHEKEQGINLMKQVIVSEEKSNTEDDATPELEKVLEAIDNYVKANKGQVCIVASFIAFSEEKINNADDVTIPGSDRFLAYGDLNSIRISLNDLRDIVEDEQEDGFVNL